MKIILASNSPRRRELLRELGVNFEVFQPYIDEDIGQNDPEKLSLSLSELKGAAALDMLRGENKLTEDSVIISADTVVYCRGQILGKPKDKKDAERMLRLLSDNHHHVFSGICLTDLKGKSSAVSTTRVFFREIPKRELALYLNTSEAWDKAGAYGIQGWAARYIRRIEGDYFGVVGLPIETLQTLFSKRYGLYF